MMKLFDLLESLAKHLGELERKAEPSRNSSKPPSSDGLRRQVAEPRAAGSKPKGGQPGHVSVTRIWTEEPDEAKGLRPWSSCGCGKALGGQPGVAGEKRQQVEIPEPKALVTEYRQVEEAMTAAGILPKSTGYAAHDHWALYFGFERATHSLCNAHILLRELRYSEWLGIGLMLFPERPKGPRQKGRPKQEPATNLLQPLRDFRAEIFRFLTDFRVPFDNNLAERLVRPVKVKLKVAGGFRALGGAEAFCILRSVWETNKRQGVNPFQTLRAAFAGVSSFIKRYEFNLQV